MNYNYFKNTLDDFYKIWHSGGDARLHLEVHGGRVNLHFQASLVSPFAPRPHPPVPGMSQPNTRRRYRGPAAKEKSRQRAKLFQERQKKSSLPSSNVPPSPLPPSSPLPPPRPTPTPPPPSSPPPTAAAPPTTPKTPSLPQCESPSSSPFYGWRTPVVKKRWKPPSSAFVKSPHTKLRMVKDNYSDSHSRRSQWRGVKVAAR